MPTAAVTIRQTTTTRSASGAVLLVNTGYLKTKDGILKLLLVILCLVVVVLVLIETQPYSYYYGRAYGFYASDLFLFIVSIGHFYLTGLMLITCLFSLSSSSLLPKISFDYVYHFCATLLFLISGLWVLIGALHTGTSSERNSRIVAASVLALVLSALHLIHGVFSYRSCTH